MAQVTLKGNPIHTNGDLPKVGAKAPDFKLTTGDLKDVSLADYKGKKKILNIVPSLDTPHLRDLDAQVQRVGGQARRTPSCSWSRPTCPSRRSGSARPRGCRTWSRSRSCATRASRRTTASSSRTARSPGICARAVVVLDENDKVIYTQLVPEIGQEPDYDKALAAAK